MKTRARLLLLLLVLVGAASAGLSARAANNDPGYPSGNPPSVTAQGYQPDRQGGTNGTTPFRSGVAAADTTVLSAANLADSTLTGARLQVNGRPQVAVSVRFSVNNQTASLAWVPIYRQTGTTTDVVLDVSSVQTFTTTGQFTDVNGKFFATSGWVFDGRGASDGRIIVVSPPSSGNIDIWVGTY